MSIEAKTPDQPPAPDSPPRNGTLRRIDAAPVVAEFQPDAVELSQTVASGEPES